MRARTRGSAAARAAAPSYRESRAAEAEFRFRREDHQMRLQPPDPARSRVDGRSSTLAAVRRVLQGLYLRNSSSRVLPVTAMSAYLLPATARHVSATGPLVRQYAFRNLCCSPNPAPSFVAGPTAIHHRPSSKRKQRPVKTMDGLHDACPKHLSGRLLL
jgi:hypothetical protein